MQGIRAMVQGSQTLRHERSLRCLRFSGQCFLQGELDSISEREEEADAAGADERAILRYEEHVTTLLVTIAQLHSKAEQLQQRRSREEDEYSDQCSEYTASLPRCVQRPRSLAIHPFPMGCVEEGGSSDVFLDLQQAVASLENAVFSRRSQARLLGSAGGETGAGGPSAVGEEWAQIAKTLEEVERGLGDFAGLPEDNGICPWKAAPRAPGEKTSEASPELSAEDMSWIKKEIATYAERNAALRVALGSKEEELSRSKVTLQTFQEEREKLQRKVKELQDSLLRIETPSQPCSPSASASDTVSTRGSVSPGREGEPWPFQDPVAAAQSLIRCLQSCSSTQHLCRLFPQHRPAASESHVREWEARTQQLRGCIEQLKGLNQLLSGTLQEWKGHSERLSMLLGQHESNSMALHLAAQYSERCVEAYEVLLSLAGVKLGPWLEPLEEGGSLDKGEPGAHAPDSPGGRMGAVLDEARRFLGRAEPEGDEAESGQDGAGTHGWESAPGPGALGPRGTEEGILHEYIRRLRAEQASVEVSLLELGCQAAPGSAGAVIQSNDDAIKAKLDEAIRVAGGVLPRETPRPKMEKPQLLHDLVAIRESMADLKTQLHLAEKETRGLELCTYTHRPQESAHLLLIEHLQGELDGQRGRCPSSGSSSSGDSTSCSSCLGDVGRREAEAARSQAALDRETMMLELVGALARSRELRGQAQGLAASLEHCSATSRVQQAQCVGITRDFFQAHSALVLAYRNARRKQEAQLQRLEAQMGAMGERHAEQLRSLTQALQRLEERRVAVAGSETCI
ncbi:Usher syndrome type-1C protein-binding protein 1 [Dermochelys coriacea]|uniref:Usher syndrome type-1C protein-binding protein 1 n=1 Tax=Dermochelys coriacea TaxID=27794 RepID=UPI001CA7CE2B|nr:Usher syndrome type-1C protein-binding protein 1 [Dermochelys coriacea]